MAIFTAIAAAIGLSATATAVFTFVGRTLLTIGVSKLLAKRATQSASAGGDGGGRVQIPPATDNKIPVVYGKAFVGGPVIDAKLSTDQKTMWYVIALAEHTDTTVGSSYSFGDIYYDGKLVTFGSNGAVASLTTNTTPAQVDNRVANKLYIYLFNNGSSSGTNTGGQTAQQILSVANGVPSGQEWTATDAMTNCAFAIVKVNYNADAGLTSLGSLTVEITNTIDKPGDALLDYMVNTRYGCAIPLSRIDTASLTALNTYSDQNITYVPVGGGSATQPRYRINGPLDTAQDCLTNLQFLVDSCDSWLQYSELTGEWKVVINQSYTDYTTLGNLFLVDSSNLIGGIDISPIDLNETYNELEVAYPNTNIKDQTDYQVLELSDYQPGVMSPNEAVNRLNVQLPLVNEAVQAKYLGVRRLLQSREDLVINFATDYSGIQIEAGDVIKVTHPVYGWTDKLFRVSNVAEEKYPDGNLGARIQAFEYNDTIYADNAIQDFVPAFNTGLENPNVIGPPTIPILANGGINTDGLNYFTISSNVPTTGTVLYMDFNVGNTSNVTQHTRFTTITTSEGQPFVNSSNVGNTVVTANITTLPNGTYYFSATARNPISGTQSGASNAFIWNGPLVTPNTTVVFCNASSNGNVVTSDAVANLLVGANLTITSGTGTLVANTYVAQVNSNTQFVLSATPTVALSNACLQALKGGISSNTIQPGAVTGNHIANGAITANNIANYSITGNKIANGAICLDQLCSNVKNTLTFNIGGTNFGIANPTANTVTMPINAAANSTRNVPIYFTGTAINTNNEYPYYQGTASTTTGTNGNNYYAANSTSSFNPANASVILAADGEDNWYIAIKNDTPNGEVPTSQWFATNYGLTLLANANCIVQTVPGYENNSQGYYTLNTSFMDTISLVANRPLLVENSFGTIPGGNITSTAVMIRNITGSANLIIVRGSLAQYTTLDDPYV